MKTILTIILTAICLSAVAQSKPDTSKQLKFHYTDAYKLMQVNQGLYNRVHKLDMATKTRDTLDLLLSISNSIIYRKLTDTAKVKGGKK